MCRRRSEVDIITSYDRRDFELELQPASTSPYRPVFPPTYRVNGTPGKKGIAYDEKTGLLAGEQKGRILICT